MVTSEHGSAFISPAQHGGGGRGKLRLWGPQDAAPLLGQCLWHPAPRRWQCRAEGPRSTGFGQCRLCMGAWLVSVCCRGVIVSLVPFVLCGHLVSTWSPGIVFWGCAPRAWGSAPWVSQPSGLLHLSLGTWSPGPG